MRQKLLQLGMLLFAFSLLMPILGHANTDDMPNMNPLGQTRDAVDAAKTIAENSGFPLPPGALDGPRSTDLMYQTLKMIFGQPLANISVYTTNADLTGDNNPVKNVNVIVFLFSMMAGIGLIATLVSSIWTILQSLVSINTSAKLFNNNGGQGSPFAFLIARMGSASILNAPIPAAGGMALSQVIMLFMALLGIGLGSQLFYFVGSRMIDQPLITYTSERNELFFINAAHGQLCLNFLEENGFIRPEQNKIHEIEISRGGEEIKSLWFGTQAQCGEIKFRFNTTPRETRSERYGSIVNWFSRFHTGSLDNVEATIEDLFKPNVYRAVKALLTSQEFNSAIKEISNSNFGENGFTPSTLITSNLASSYAAYKGNIEKIFFELDEKVNACENRPARDSSASWSTLGCSNEILKESIATYGFMLAGTYSYILNERQSVLSNAMESFAPRFEFEPTVVLSKFSIFEDSPYFIEYVNRQTMLEETFEFFRTRDTSLIAKDLNQLYEATTGDGAFAEALGDILYSSMRQIVKVGYLGQNASFQNPEPITQLSQIGNVMMATPLAIAGLSRIANIKKFGIAGLANKAKDFASSAGKQINPKGKDGVLGMVFAMMLAAMLQAIVVGGFFLAVFVPAIPYVMWNMAIFGYIAYVILVVIGVPIMVAAKPLNDGDGFIGGVKTGYMMAFTVFIRPAAMVIGLVAAMVLSRVFSWIINATYFESMQIAHSNGFSVAAVFGVPLMYAVIQLTAIYKAYSMINEVPAFIGKMTETDRAHSDFGEEGERNRVGGLFIQSGTSAMGGMHRVRSGGGAAAVA